MTSMTINIDGVSVYLEDGTVGHAGHVYSLTAMQLMVANTPQESMLLDDLDWLLNCEAARPTDQARIDAADITKPLIVYDDPDYGWTVLDGIHRLAKIATGPADDPAYTIVPVKVLDRLPTEAQALIAQGMILIQSSERIDQADKDQMARNALIALDQIPLRVLKGTSLDPQGGLK